MLPKGPGNRPGVGRLGLHPQGLDDPGDALVVTTEHDELGRLLGAGGGRYRGEGGIGYLSGMHLVRKAEDGALHGAERTGIRPAHYASDLLLFGPGGESHPDVMRPLVLGTRQVGGPEDRDFPQQPRGPSPVRAWTPPTSCCWSPIGA